jgi:pyoverdine/dityrosine biosynthesis protein Dit1
MTYRGYIKFLQTDLETVYPVDGTRTKSKYKRGIEYIAKQMMARGDVSDYKSGFGVKDDTDLI